MRILLFILLVSSLTMCKSKDNIPASEKLSYIVVLKEDVKIKKLEKDVKYSILEAKRISKSHNQWTIDFESDGNKSNGIKRDLLNLEYVISVMTPGEFGTMNSKSSKKGRVSPIKERQRQK